MRLKIGRADKRRIRGALGIDFDLGKYNVGPTAFFEVPCRISVAADLARDFSVGAFTTISPSDGNGRFLHNLSIGRYCSIAAGVWVAPHEHPIPWLTTNPISYGAGMFKWADRLLGRKSLTPGSYNHRRSVKIGNDVWIGRGAFIKGGCCDVANQLKHRGLRPCAFPLDWTLMVDEKPLRYLPEGIRTRFKCLCVRKNMVEFQLPSREYGVERHKFEDRATGFRFIHHFSCPVEDVDAFEKTRQILLLVNNNKSRNKRELCNFLITQRERDIPLARG